MTNKELFEKVNKLLNDNMEKGGGKNKPFFHFTRPSPGTYPYNFFWDTCFHVFIFCSLGEDEMAKKHIRSLFALQNKDEFVGHMIYWNRLKPGRWTDIFQSLPRLRNLFRSHTSAIIQPPLVAQAVERIYESSGDKKFLKEMLPKLKKYYSWLAGNRDFQNDKLLTIISSFESGMDWKPTFDVPAGFKPGRANWQLFLRLTGIDFRNYINNYNYKRIYKKGYFLVKDVAFNTIYAQNLRAMSRLCQIMNDPDAKAYAELSNKVVDSIMELMYNKEDDAFYDCYGKDNEQIKILTPTIFYPVILDGISEEVRKAVTKRHFFNNKEFQMPYPLPSLAKKEAAFNPNQSIYIWRGPTWIVHNWFLHKFIMIRGYGDESKKLVESIKN
ncbi:MGH1-like glycoside hydrolase domain-containing protein [Autumnicola musiva]|uniref:Trehalase-like protein n=1 Tax=Autumnicola musiva TaxID=3075589 RepID=A0ABU3D611_9FLAO|nr:amylo-alpha-1,6-glucosidase [Zunongwangia sp. F117]MDT0676976.1 trehalase-like protein [Zunongwangia sp. F117]